MDPKSSLPDLMTLLIGIGKVIPSIIMLMQLCVMLIGVYMTISGLIELWGSQTPNVNKFLSRTESYSLTTGVVQLFLGGLFLSLGTLEFVGVLSRSLTGDYAAVRMTAESLSYTPGASVSAQEKAKAVTLALLALLQAVGFVGITKSLLTINRHVKQTGGGATIGNALAWGIGGVLAWNFKWFSDVINNTIGFDFISLFTSLK
ncbi:hypothetical protein [Castellaniella sp.]|uniref:hypothetical protein n=1 Tax=Castellaniella sp. TaxID=1955812 RepID=UPI002AFE3295|nr:hypothetical protein [Castellaniella sp.]